MQKFKLGDTINIYDEFNSFIGYFVFAHPMYLRTDRRNISITLTITKSLNTVMCEKHDKINSCRMVLTEKMNKFYYSKYHTKTLEELKSMMTNKFIIKY